MPLYKKCREYFMLCIIENDNLKNRKNWTKWQIDPFLGFLLYKQFGNSELLLSINTCNIIMDHGAVMYVLNKLTGLLWMICLCLKRGGKSFKKFIVLIMRCEWTDFNSKWLEEINTIWFFSVWNYPIFSLPFSHRIYDL